MLSGRVFSRRLLHRCSEMMVLVGVGVGARSETLEQVAKKEGAAVLLRRGMRPE